ncbi:hypothetical protein D6810_03340 [Candidatus Dojkabacteria bacterium]|uniref:Uncharacterized protein n=1 Tax=Candidatus Dojkabacteria bacterium TaxID=2099670 RepID=A0A3M0YZ59_9BACT|nr:MAG: hypothetical protein D6810_03340 [Candidatus Dojkabacteria bacterium]
MRYFVLFAKIHVYFVVTALVSAFLGGLLDAFLGVGVLSNIFGLVVGYVVSFTLLLIYLRKKSII